MHDSVLCRENREGPKQLRMIQRVVAAAVELHGPVSPCRIIAREIRLCYLIQGPRDYAFRGNLMTMCVPASRITSRLPPSCCASS